MTLDFEAPSREIAATSDAVRLAIAAVKANPPLNPLPWREDDSVVRSANSNAVAQWAEWADAAHIAAAVNAAPLLIAEVERLQAVVEAAREAVDCWPVPPHSFYCGFWRGSDGYDSRLCDCDVEQRRHDRAHARRALGLEVGNGRD